MTDTDKGSLTMPGSLIGIPPLPANCRTLSNKRDTGIVAANPAQAQHIAERLNISVSSPTPLDKANARRLYDAFAPLRQKTATGHGMSLILPFVAEGVQVVISNALNEPQQNLAWYFANGIVAKRLLRQMDLHPPSHQTER